MTRHRPKPLFLTLAAVSVTALAFLLAHFLEIHLLYAHLIGVNLTTFVMYGSDKQRAVHSDSRIPEVVLHLLALAGGSPAAFFAQITFRHKTRKRVFRTIFIAIVLLQIIAAAVFFLKHTHHVAS
ncbi:MAG: DUF1294 domain-containing protein [Planctomycetota bacterium]